jgi:hypothetical protein
MFYDGTAALNTQGKAAEAAALGNTPPTQPSFFLSGLTRTRQTRKKKRGDHFKSATQGGASLALGYNQVIPTGFHSWLALLERRASLAPRL